MRQPVEEGDEQYLWYPTWFTTRSSSSEEPWRNPRKVPDDLGGVLVSASYTITPLVIGQCLIQNWLMALWYGSWWFIPDLGCSAPTIRKKSMIWRRKLLLWCLKLHIYLDGLIYTDIFFPRIRFSPAKISHHSPHGSLASRWMPAACWKRKPEPWQMNCARTQGIQRPNLILILYVSYSYARIDPPKFGENSFSWVDTTTSVS